MLHIAWKTYTLYDVCGKCDCVVITRKIIYTWHNRKKKKWNAKVRNYNLRGSEKEMNMKVLNFIEINKRSGWKIAPLRKKVMNGSVQGY